MSNKKTAISPTRAENFPEWYQQVVKAADIAENSPVRGCMVIKPWGYGIWELLQRELDDRIKASGVDNAYFPLFIPLSFLEKEAAHVDGFAKECAVVTHHRLELKDGKLVPTGELEEPLIVRPTSETIIGDSFSKWVKSYRDLPLRINQWANVVRWEMRPRLFLRTAEFLWQEGHTVHADKADAMWQVEDALRIYKEVIEDILAIPVVIGEKSDGERFPGAVNTYSLEAMMQDGKALQAGTSHYLGTNFADASNIKYLDDTGNLQLAHTTSWGVSTRLIGALIMSHSDDDGLRVPPKVAPKQAVILPVIPKAELSAEVLQYADLVEKRLRQADSSLRLHTDKRDLRGGDKNWQWIKKGIPLRIEVGPRDAASKSVMLHRRDNGEKIQVALENLPDIVKKCLEEIQKSYFNSAKDFLNKNTKTDIRNVSEFSQYFNSTSDTHWVKAHWSGDEAETEKVLGPLKVTIRCLPRDSQGVAGKCVITGKETSKVAIFAKAY